MPGCGPGSEDREEAVGVAGVHAVRAAAILGSHATRPPPSGRLVAHTTIRRSLDELGTARSSDGTLRDALELHGAIEVDPEGAVHHVMTLDELDGRTDDRELLAPP